MWTLLKGEVRNPKYHRGETPWLCTRLLLGCLQEQTWENRGIRESKGSTGCWSVRLSSRPLCSTSTACPVLPNCISDYFPGSGSPACVQQPVEGKPCQGLTKVWLDTGVKYPSVGLALLCTRAGRFGRGAKTWSTHHSHEILLGFLCLPEESLQTSLPTLFPCDRCSWARNPGSAWMLHPSCKENFGQDVQ